jgi:hypothetical protein
MTDPIPVMPTTGGGRGSEQYGNNVKSWSDWTSTKLW